MLFIVEVCHLFSLSSDESMNLTVSEYLCQQYVSICYCSCGVFIYIF